MYVKKVNITIDTLMQLGHKEFTFFNKLILSKFDGESILYVIYMPKRHSEINLVRVCLCHSLTILHL